MTKRIISEFSTEGKALYQKILIEYAIHDQAGLAILKTAIEAHDRMRAAKMQIDKEGLTYLDRWGQTKVHPLCSVERDARAQFLAALKALNLDVEPLRDGPGRPGGK